MHFVKEYQRNMLPLALLAYLFSTIQCDVQNPELQSGQMMGVNTFHDPTPVVINKDTIITRNLKLEKRRMGKAADIPKTQDSGPSYSPVPESIRAHVDQFKRNMSECLKEVQNDKTVRRLSPKPESPVHGECLIACVLKRNGVIGNRKVNKDNLINLVNKFFGKDTKLMKKLEKNLDQCIEMSAHHRDECELAARLNGCTNDLMAANKHHIYVNY